MEPTAMNAQQTAIQDVRARYERGELSFDEFRRALDALVLARDADECQAILRELPASPQAPLAVLEPMPPPATPTPAEQRHKWIVAFMGQTKKMRRPWRLAPATDALAIMGEVKLDLSVAQLPPRAKIQVAAVMGSVTLFVPRSTRVAVRSVVLLGDASALGEHANGVVAFGHEEHTPAAGPAVAELEVEAFVLMGNVQVVLTDRPIVSVSELVRDALRAAADGVRRGLQQGASPAPGAGGAPDAEGARLAGPAESPRDDTRR
jgi:Cell wall-active antibiotics response 4TMS YvqF